MVGKEKGNSCDFLSFFENKEEKVGPLFFGFERKRRSLVVFVRWLSGEKKKRMTVEGERSSIFFSFPFLCSSLELVLSFGSSHTFGKSFVSWSW